MDVSGSISSGVVLGMVVHDVGIVRRAVVAADQDVPRRVGQVRVRAVQRVAVEEEGIARLRFHMNVLEQLHGFPDALHVRAGLAAVNRVLDPPHPVAAPEDLEAAVLTGGRD